ncbi:hypothetical protein [Niveibacterium terrae]|uniref:zinc ribbon domain-containing protein n=1 Tax=Niveibacterium terrae TaxID=3373598 RepID=UPI003A939F45
MQSPAPALTTGRYSVFRIPEALSNWRAVLLIIASVLGFALLAFIGKQLPAALGWIFMLAGFVVYLAGLSGVGACLLDQARGKTFNPLASYFTRGLFSLPRLLGIFLLMLLTLLAVILVAAIYFALCKIPVLGALLLAVGIPVLVAALAITLSGIYVTLALAGPAIWDGLDIATALKASFEILCKHSWSALAKILGGAFLSLLIASLFLSIVWSAGGIVAGLGFGILGMSGSGAGGLAMQMATMMYGNNQPLVFAAAFGFGVVAFVSIALISLMPCMVAALTWLEFSEQIDLANVSEEAGATVDALRQKIRETQDRFAAPAPSSPVETTAQPTAQAKPEVQAEPEPVPAPAASPVCPRCGAILDPNDKFCGDCGQKTTRH